MCLNCVKIRKETNNNNNILYSPSNKRKYLFLGKINTVAERVLGKIKGIYSRCVFFLCVKITAKYKEKKKKRKETNHRRFVNNKKGKSSKNKNLK